MKTEDKKPNNPLAFPTLLYSKHSGDMNGHEEGMTLRDYFAAKALNVADTYQSSNIEKMVEVAYRIADEMLKQREL